MRARVLAVLGLFAPASVFAHAGGLEAAPVAGLAIGLFAGALFVLVPARWKKLFVVAFACLLLGSVVIQAFSEPEFPKNPFVVLWWLSLAFPFFICPAGLSFWVASAGLSSIVQRWLAWRRLRSHHNQTAGDS